MSVTALAVTAGLLTAPPAHAEGWVPAVTIEKPHNWGQRPRVGVGPDGTATVAWQGEQDNGPWVPMVATRAPGAASYGAATPLSGPASGVDDLEVLVDPLGTATVIWIEARNGDPVIRAAVRPAGAADFLPAQDLAGSEGAEELDLDSDATGHLTVAWYDESSKVSVATREPGAVGFGAATPVAHDHDAESSLALDVASDGSAALLIDSTVGVGEDVVQVATRPDAGTAFGTAVPLWTPTLGLQARDPDVVVHDGRVTMAWAASDDDRWVEVSEGPLAGPFSAPVPLSEPGRVSGVGLAADHERVTLVWNGRAVDEDDYRVRGADRVHGQAAFGEEFLISPTGVNANGKAVLVTAAGVTTVVWDGYTDSGSTVQAAIRAPGQAGFGPARTLQTPSVPMAIVRSVAAEPDGEATTVWRVDTGSGTLMRSMVADRTSPAVLGLTIPDRVRLGRSMPVSVSSADRWPGVTAAWDFGDGRTAKGHTAARTYLSAGTYAVRMTLTDRVGNQTTRLASVVVMPPPAVLSAAFATKRFSGKTRLAVRANEPGQMRMAVQRCRPDGSAACARWVRKGTRIRDIGADVASYRFPARIDGERLKPGRYRLVLRLVADDGTISRKKTRPFRVLPSDS